MGLRWGYEGNQGKSAFRYRFPTVSPTRGHPGSAASGQTPELRFCSFHQAPFPGFKPFLRLVFIPRPDSLITGL
jgi:hypothetical protein